MQYTVIEHFNFTTFIEKVNAAITLGWMPQGGVSKAISPGNSETWSQAMVKEVK